MSDSESDKPVPAVAQAAAPGAHGDSGDARASADAAGAGPGRLGGLLSAIVPRFALIVAGIAILISGWLWWQYRQFYVELAADDALLLETLEDTRAGLRRQNDEVAALRSGLQANGDEIDALREDLELLPAELRALGRRIEALQGGSLDAREIWLRERAEYYLVLAGTELALGNGVPSTIAALELADDVLRDIGDPDLLDVRTAIASELQDLRAVDVPDLAGLASEIGGLIRRVPDLPMRAAAPENFGAEEENLDDIEPGLGRLWARTRGAVTSIVRIERQEEPVGPILTESERRIARRQLELELEIARAALIDARQADYRAALVAADAILDRDFARGVQSIVEARRLLGNLMQAELAPPLPDIGDSLTLLRAAPGAR